MLISLPLSQYKGRSNIHLGPDVLLRQRSVAMSHTFSNLREMCDRFKLPPGDYVVIPSTFEPHRKGSFVLRVFSEKHAATRWVQRSKGSKVKGSKVKGLHFIGVRVSVYECMCVYVCVSVSVFVFKM